MISKEENQSWTRVGPGTPAGEMLRRYWWPIAFGDEIKGPDQKGRPKKVKLLGEEFVLFRDGSGKVGMVEPQCAHRRAPLQYGRVEKAGIRCCYHGWVFDTAGKCLETPCEDEGSTLKDRVSVKACKTQELAGLVFAYIGSAPAPLLPKYDLLVHTSGTRYVYGNPNNCNWVQTAENAADATHLNWLHAGPYPSYAGKRQMVEYFRRDWGIQYVTKTADLPMDKSSSLIFPCHNRFASARLEQGGARQNMIFRVPEDDTRTLNFFITVIPDQSGVLKHITGNTPDRAIDGPGPWIEKVRGVYRPGDEDWWGVESTEQDRMALEGQGEVYDRNTENLAASDKGVALYRVLLKESLAAVAEGRDPVGIVRDPAKHTLIEFGTRLHALLQPLEIS
jgi:5,5'-dehydrodivanillate O-demethylase